MRELQETWVWFLGWEYPPEEEMATHSRISAWRIPWMEEPGGLEYIASQSWISLKRLSVHTYNVCFSLSQREEKPFVSKSYVVLLLLQDRMSWIWTLSEEGCENLGDRQRKITKILGPYTSIIECEMQFVKIFESHSGEKASRGLSLWPRTRARETKEGSEGGSVFSWPSVHE